MNSDLGLVGVNALASDGHRIVAVGYGGASTEAVPFVSVDGGLAWEAIPLPPPSAESASEFVTTSVNLDSVTVTADRILLVGREVQNIDWRAYALNLLGEDHGHTSGLSSSGEAMVVTFQDGFELTVSPSALGLDLQGSSTMLPIVFIYDGDTWTRSPQGTWGMGGNGSFEIASSSAGFASIVQSNVPGIEAMISSDGKNWQGHPLPAELSERGGSIVGGVHGFVAIGNSGIYHSMDGIEWTKVHSFEDHDPPTMQSPAASHPSAGGAGYVLPVVDSASSNPIARLFSSRDGISWTERALPAGTFDAATAVSDTSALVIPIVQGAPGSSLPTLPADNSTVADALAAAFHNEASESTGDQPHSFRPVVNESQARCIANGLIDRLGMQRIRELRLGIGPWSLLFWGLALPIDKADAESMVTTFEECTPTWKLLMVQSATQGTEFISTESAECVRQALDDNVAHDMFVFNLYRPYDDDPSTDLSLLTALADSYTPCLTNQENNALDWD
ncbi:MAG: hypothetical protein ABI706_08240 [Ilumatobacteraceae bacterium]